jgi:hypothetical protein
MKRTHWIRSKICQIKVWFWSKNHPLHAKKWIRGKYFVFVLLKRTRKYLHTEVQERLSRSNSDFIPDLVQYMQTRRNMVSTMFWSCTTNWKREYILAEGKRVLMTKVKVRTKYYQSNAKTNWGVFALLRSCWAQWSLINWNWKGRLLTSWIPWDIWGE